MKLLAIPLSAVKHAPSGWLCANRHWSRAVLGILMYLRVHSGACAPGSSNVGSLATISDAMYRLLLLCLLLFTACAASPPPRQYAVSDDQMNDLVMYAVSLADTPYRYGGNSSNSGFDCSGFVGHVYRHTLNISLPRTSRDISRIGKPISQSELEPGDLVFYNTSHASFSHVGIYVGDGKFVHSPRTGESVRTEQMEMRYWRTRYDGARRIRR